MIKISLKIILILFLTTCISNIYSQNACINGNVNFEGKPILNSQISIIGLKKITFSDSVGMFKIPNLKVGKYTIEVEASEFEKLEKTINIKNGDSLFLFFNLIKGNINLKEVVITGTLKETSKLESLVPVEVFTPSFFKKNPTPNIYESLQNINGVRPQLNCQVCNTGDIHINGLEGPYTMILIDGMPIVSSLSSVYGLSGIPNAIIERVEIVKGPASSLYGSEAIGGLINIITKKPKSAPILTADLFSTSWGEHNIDIGLKINASKNISLLTGINYFNFSNKIDKNNDNFTDMTLQNRISVFQKWNFNRNKNRIFSLAARYMYEDRWGGELNWNTKFRGGDSVYGESIYTKRWELIGNYQLPTKEKLLLSYSFNNHNQNSVYGKTIYIAKQNIGFAQLTWDKKLGINDFLFGTALRYTFYDDNTPATANEDSIKIKNQPQKTYLPGVFIQNEIKIAIKHTILLGFRYDYNSYHGNILTPRFAYKWTVNKNSVLRLNAGTGYRVVNLFTEDHAALTGARIIEIKNSLKPERSYNLNINYVKNLYYENGTFIGLDATAFYSYYNNRIVGDYETDPNKIVYDNLNGNAQGKGFSLNVDVSLKNGLKILVGGTLMENTLTNNGITKQQILTENFTGTWSASYKIKKIHLNIDYTGNIYSPMRLPLLGNTDPRKANSPWWSIQNIQFTYTKFKNFEVYGGVKNLLNWTPNKGNPFIIARSNDPFDKKVQFNANGEALVTPSNPYGLTFDPSYVFAPNQGARVFAGIRLSVN